jgi:hypothetical protein
VLAGGAALLPKLDPTVCPVAQRLVRGLAAAAEGDAISGLERLTVGSAHRDAARDPECSGERALLLGDGDRHR